jgi:hypothetical protein
MYIPLLGEYEGIVLDYDTFSLAPLTFALKSGNMYLYYKHCTGQAWRGRLNHETRYMLF